MSDISERIKQLRTAAGLTQASVAERMNVHTQTVSKWERGKCDPDLSSLGDLAGCFGVSVDALLGCGETDGSVFGGAFDISGLGRAIAAERKRISLSQSELAEEAGVPADTVSKWERGIVAPPAEDLVRLARRFGVPVSRLYYGVLPDAPVPAHAAAAKRGGMPLTALLAAAGLVIAALAVFVGLFATGALRTDRIFSVIAAGREYAVSEYDWFTPDVPELAGYDFVCWTDGSGDAVSFPRKITEDASYDAVYSPREYRIDYWTGGGVLSDAPSVITVESGSVTLPIPTKSGSEFLGWHTLPDLSDEPVTAVTCAAADVSLYAEWSDGAASVRYELCGGVMPVSNPETVATEEKLLAEPVREGYIFLGWYDSPNGGTRYESVGGDGARNITLYAVWQQTDEVYSVTYELCGGSMSEENPLAMEAGVAYALADPERSGYEFVGWCDSADGSGTYYEELYGIYRDITLYAVWTPGTYLVRYEYEGSYVEGNVNPNYITYGERVELYPVALRGHTFLGWYDAPEGGNRVTAIDASNLLTLDVLYARYEANEYTVTLDAGAGTLPGDNSITVIFGDRVELPTPVLAGYDFLGWYDADGNRMDEINEKNAFTMTLTAKWRASDVTYGITYELCGGSAPSEPDPTVVSPGQTFELHAPEKEGYNFLGWCDKADGSGDYYEYIPADIAGDLTLYAVWQEITVSGSSENFEYKVGVRGEVTLTGYNGPFGANVEIDIPSFIDGRPVTRISGRFVPEDTGAHEVKSLTIPESITEITDGAFADLIIAEPLYLPASVERIDGGAFEGATLELYFAESSGLTEIGDNAFDGADVLNVPVLPEGLERLGENALAAICNGFVLPETLTEIAEGSLAWSHGNSMAEICVYLPGSVTKIVGRPFLGNHADSTVVYTPLSEEQTVSLTAGTGGAVKVVRLTAEESEITLVCGDDTTVLRGHAFSLPVPEDAGGRRFIGWKERGGGYGNMYHIPTGDITLDAVFASGVADGSSPENAIELGAGESVTVEFAAGDTVYLVWRGGDATVRAETFTVTAYGVNGWYEKQVSLYPSGGAEDRLPDNAVDTSGAYFEAEDGEVFELSANDSRICGFTYRVDIRFSV